MILFDACMHATVGDREGGGRETGIRRFGAEKVNSGGDTRRLLNDRMRRYGCEVPCRFDSTGFWRRGAWLHGS